MYVDIEAADKYQEFFNFMSQEHDLILTIEQMDEILSEAQKLVKKLTIPAVVCSSCGAENSIRWDKHSIGIDDKQGSYKDLSFQFCENCGDVTNVDFS